MKSKLLSILPIFLLTSLAMGYEPWPEDIVDQFASTPVIHNGRIKPFQTVATDSLFELSGRTKLEVQAKGKDYKLTATEWLMDVLFRPEYGRAHQSFGIDDHDVVVRIESMMKQKKRDRYSYDELFLETGNPRRKLGELAGTYQQKRQNDEKLDYLEEQVLLLAKRVSVYEGLAGTMVPVQPEGNLSLDTSLSEFLKDIPTLGMEQVEGMLRAGPEAMQAFGEQGASFYRMLERLYIMYRSSDGLLFFPPEDPANHTWESTSSLIEMALSNEGEQRQWAIDRLVLLENVAANAGDFDAFKGALMEYKTFVTNAAENRNELAGLEAEMAFNKDPFLMGPRIMFIFAFILVAVSWAFAFSKPGKYLAWGSIAMGGIGFLLLCQAMFYRSVIRGWAPVTNLYETFLFIAAGGFLFGVIFEYFTKKRIALSVGVILPMTCLLLANLFREANPSEDTLPPLVAVLRSNFWLTTHVLTITLGYCAGLVAALVSHFWIVGQAFKINLKEKQFYKFITGMAYGIVLFSLLFSLVGTVLGGIWANYSWGRFWGWDPKENGALMIVLWTLFILHARLGGMIKDLGLHVCTILLGCIITFSWFGVNALGVGLHSYGFLGGVWRALFIFWSIELVVFGMAVWIKLRDNPESLKGMQGLLDKGPKKAEKPE